MELNSRSTPLNKDEIESFINNHIPYRLKILDLVVAHNNKKNEDLFWPSIYESAQITCRMFIQFMGFKLKFDSNNNPYLVEDTSYHVIEKKSFEVKIKDLGFEFIKLNELNFIEKEILAHACVAGNIATAHLTYNTGFNPNPVTVIQAAIIIKRLINERLYIQKNDG